MRPEGTGMSDHDLWNVKLSEGCVVEMTLDEIDTAFNAGRISAGTSVLPPGDFVWTTLGEAAGLEDDDRETMPAPYSIAPVAADITPSPPMVELDSAFDIDVDLASNAGLPKKGSGVFGKVVGIGAFFVFLIGAGIVGGAYAARPAEFKAKVSTLRDRFSHSPAKAAAAATPAPPPPIVQSSREIPPPPPAVATPEPVPAAAPAAIPTMQASSSSTMSVSNLPDAKSKKAPAKKKR